MPKPGDPGTMTVDTGGMSPSVDKPTNCDDLEDKNKDLRDELSKKPTPEPLRTAFKPGGPTTVAHGSLNGGAPVGTTSRLLPQRFDKKVAKGLWADPKRKAIKARSSNLCPEPPFKYEKGYRPHQSHCESKILEDMFAAKPPPGQGDTILLNINWQATVKVKGKKLKVVKKVPCKACEQLLKHAVHKCKVNVQLCTASPSPGQPPGSKTLKPATFA